MTPSSQEMESPENPERFSRPTAGPSVLVFLDGLGHPLVRTTAPNLDQDPGRFKSDRQKVQTVRLCQRSLLGISLILFFGTDSRWTVPTRGSLVLLGGFLLLTAQKMATSSENHLFLFAILVSGGLLIVPMIPLTMFWMFSLSSLGYPAQRYPLIPFTLLFTGGVILAAIGSVKWARWRLHRLERTGFAPGTRRGSDSDPQP